MIISVKYTGKFADDRKWLIAKVNIICQFIIGGFAFLCKVVKLCTVCNLIGIFFGAITIMEFFLGAAIPCIRIRKRGCGYHAQAQHKCQQQAEPLSFFLSFFRSCYITLFCFSCQVLNCDSNILGNAFHFHVLCHR